LSMEKILIKL